MWITPATLAGLTTAGLAITGAVWFGLLSLGAAIAYDPVGVRPSEVGLGSGTVLSQSAVGLAFIVALMAIAELILWVLTRSIASSEGAAAASKPSVRIVGGVASTGIVVLVVATIFVLSEAFAARRAIRAGEAQPDSVYSFGLPKPWSGEVAELKWAQGKPAGAPTLPNCALYLGGDGGMVVFYDAATKRTWRLPSSTLIVTTEPNKDKC